MARSQPLVRATIDLLRRDGTDWAEAILAELAHVPAGRRTLWALGGLWGLTVRQPATWLIRVLALFGIVWKGVWLWASIEVLTDDAPDMPWPYNLWMVIAQSAVVVIFAVALVRPLLGVALALAVIPAYCWVLWESVTANDGFPALAVALFAGLPAGLVAAIGLLAVLRRYLSSR